MAHPDTVQTTKVPNIASLSQYEELYRRSIADPEGFWAGMAEHSLTWQHPWHTIMQYDPQHLGTSNDPYVGYFLGGKLNVSENCLDRHVAAGKGNQTAIIWFGERGDQRQLSFNELLDQTNRAAQVLVNLGIQPGDPVVLYLPMIPEAAVFMLACARIGAPHCVVFSAFSAQALQQRIQDSNAKLVITADAGFYNGKTIPLKNSVDTALKNSPSVRHILVVKHVKEPISMQPGRDAWWHEEASKTSDSLVKPTPMDSEDPLFMLYTSGSTGEPKAIVHSTAGYLLQTHLTVQYLFANHANTIHFCTADIGWITGHSYVVYGPLSNGITTVMVEGHPTHPKADRLWEVIEKCRATTFYTAPTAIRMLMRLGDDLPSQHNLSSLKILGSVGEPINPAAWHWYNAMIGKNALPIVDSWWQTETGAIMIAPIPGVIPTKPGSAAKPFFGIEPAVVKADGTPAEINEEGILVINRPWPGMVRKVLNDINHQRLYDTYFSQIPGSYYTGDGASIDEDGYFWISGRIDDVINVAAHRISSIEVESVITSHPAVAEAAVVGAPHDIKGSALHCFITLRDNTNPKEIIQQQIVSQLRTAIGPFASPEKIIFTDSLPKTRSGKIMRRLLRAIASGTLSDTEDTSTLADPTVIDFIQKQYQ